MAISKNNLRLVRVFISLILNFHQSYMGKVEQHMSCAMLKFVFGACLNSDGLDQTVYPRGLVRDFSDYRIIGYSEDL